MDWTVDIVCLIGNIGKRATTGDQGVVGVPAYQYVPCCANTFVFIQVVEIQDGYRDTLPDIGS